MSHEITEPLSRAQRRLLRRIYNGRTVPIEVEGKAFLTFKDASRFLQSLPLDAREAVYLAMKAKAGSGQA